MTTTKAPRESATEFIHAARERQAVLDLEARKQWGARWGVDPGVRPHRLSNWALGNLDQCDFRYYLANVLGVEPASKALALVFGSAVDAGFTAWMRPDGPGSMDDGLRAFRETWADTHQQIDWEQAQWDPATWESIGTKMLLRLQEPLRDVVPFAVQHTLDHAPIVNPATGEALQGFVVSGRIDMVDESTPPGATGTYHVITDLKTTASLTPDDQAYLVTRVSLQLTMYAYAAQHDSLLRDQLGIGQVVSYLQAQKLKTAPKTGTGVKRTWADLAPDAFTELYHLLRIYASRILTNQAAEQAGAEPWHAWPRNMGGCIGKYGPCDFLRLCRPELFEGDPVERFRLRGAR